MNPWPKGELAEEHRRGFFDKLGAAEVARERREEEIRAELREKIAAQMESADCICGEVGGFYCPEAGWHHPSCPRAIAARIRAGEFG